jgi:iron complex transport system substrate-binding protein
VVLVAGGLVLWRGCGAAKHQAASETSAPERIIALAPSAAETVHALGLGERVVGVGEYVQWPPELAAKPRLGGLFNPDFESIVALRPDLAILLEGEESLRERLEAVGVEVLTVPSDSLGDVERAVELVAARCGVRERGDEVLKQWRLELLPQPLSLEPEEGVLSVALVVGRDPQRLGDMVVAGPDTFFDELLGRLGALNAFGDVTARYPQIGVEEILRRQPDVVLEVQPFYVHELREAQLRSDWRELGRGAVATPCVAIVQGDHVLVPGPRLPLVYGQLRTALESCLSDR